MKLMKEFRADSAQGLCMKNYCKKILGIVVLCLLLSGNAYAYDSTKYYKCYGEMTTAHKARGLHKSNRPLSIKIKETVCKAYANGEIDSYEGKE